MSEANKSFVVTSATSTTGTLKRTVSDWIRRLNPAIAPVMALVKSSDVDPMGDLTQSKGLIDKESTDTMKFEWFTSTPIAIYYDATGGSSTTAVITDTTAFIPRDIIVNLNTMEVAIVNTLTSSTTLTVTAVTATWSCVADDKIAMACNAQEEAAATATSRTKEPNNNFNYVFPFRFPVSIADTAKDSPHYGEPIWKRIKQDNQFFTLRNIDNALILSERAVSETTSVTIDSVAYPMYTTRGLYNYAGNTFDCGGTMTFDRFNVELFKKLPDTMKPTSTIKMICGKNIWAQLNNWVAQKLIYMEAGEKNIFGVSAKKFQCGSYVIEPMMHDLFNKGPLASQALIFDTDDLKFRFKAGLDLQPKEKIQNPSVMGTTDELRGCIGLQCKSGGANVTRLFNWNA